MKTLPLGLLHKLLRCDPVTGKLFWRERPVDMFSDGGKGREANCNSWNAKYEGQEALAVETEYGYYRGTILGSSYNAHRVAWALTHNAWPSDKIDHINGVRNDNRLENMRVVISSDNNKNACIPSDNKSGVIGVCWVKAVKKWKSYISDSGKQKTIGFYLDKGDAISARKAAEIKHGYHPNHGRLA